MRILNPGRDSKTQNYEMCNPNINICYKFTRTYSHLHFSHFVSSINQTINIILNNLSNFINNSKKYWRTGLRSWSRFQNSKTQNYEMYIPNLNICYKFTRTQLQIKYSHFI